MKITPSKRRRFRIRKKISGTSSYPRLAIYKSLTSIYVQIIDDEASRTLAASSVKGKKNIVAAKELGEKICEIAKKVNIEKVVFDRAGLRYHGVLKAFAESARENGLKF